MQKTETQYEKKLGGVLIILQSIGFIWVNVDSDFSKKFGGIKSYLSKHLSTIFFKSATSKRLEFVTKFLANNLTTEIEKFYFEGLII
jgi:hypothetical protein